MLERYRSIIVPLDAAAQKALDYDTANENQLITRRVTQNEFNYLYNCGIFAGIDDLADSNIGDNESEEITDPESLQKIITFLEVFPVADDFKSMLAELKSLVLAAIKHKTGLFLFM